MIVVGATKFYPPYISIFLIDGMVVVGFRFAPTHPTFLFFLLMAWLWWVSASLLPTLHFTYLLFEG